MNLIGCDGQLAANADGTIVCSGTLVAVADNTNGLMALSPEDYAQIRGDVLTLFAIVFGILVLKKALQ